MCVTVLDADGDQNPLKKIRDKIRVFEEKFLLFNFSSFQLPRWEIDKYGIIFPRC